MAFSSLVSSARLLSFARSAICRPSTNRLQLAVATLSIALLALLPTRAHAQACLSLDPPCTNDRPRVTIAPATGTFTTSSISVTFNFSDGTHLDFGSLSIPSISSRTDSWTSGYTAGTITGTLTLSTGSNTIIVDIADEFGLHGADTVTLTYSPLPSPPAQDTAAVSLAPYSSTIRTIAGCSGCLYGSASYSTPAYISRDIPRSVTLVYSSPQAVPVGLVQVDATVNTSGNPDYISLQLMQGGSSASLTNGGTVAWYDGTTGTMRLGAQLDASGLATGVYDYQAVVKTWWSGTPLPRNVPIRVLVLNAASSVAGAGWTIAGLQRLVSAGGDSVAIADGAGGIVFFKRTGSTSFDHSDGDFTVLTVNVGSGVYTRTSTDGSYARFNSSGLLTAVGTRFGDSTTYGYDGSSRLTSITDEAGKTTTLTYAPDGSCLGGATSGTLCAITTPGGRVSKFIVNGSNDLVQINDPDGVTAFSGTYSGHKLTAIVDRLGATTTLAYDSFTGLTSITAPSITTTTTGGSTSTASPVTTIKSIESLLLSTSNNSSGARIAPAKADTAWAMVFAPNGDTTKMVLRGAGEPTKLVIAPIGLPARTVTTTYNFDLLPSSVTSSPVGGTATYGWTGDRLTNSVDANGTLTETNLTTYGQPTTVFINGMQQQRSYYSGGNVTLDSVVSVPGKVKTTYTIDGHGRPTSIVDAHGTSTMTYEGSGFQNNYVATRGGTSATKTHDQYGRDSTITDQLSNVTTVLYDVLNRVTSTTQPGSAVTSTSFSENTTSHTITATVTDPRSLTFTNVVNALGWGTSATDPQSNSTSAGYDRNGLLRRAVNRASGVVTADYDSAGRVVSRTANSATTTFAYDASTSPVSPHWMVAANSDSRDSVTTDAQGRPTSIVSIRGGNTYTSTMSYDAAGNRRQLTVSKNSGWTDSLQFINDTVMYPIQLPDFGGTWTAVRYTSDALVDTLRFPTGGSSTRLKFRPSSYNDFHRPGLFDVYVGSSLQEHWSYFYDALDRLSLIDIGSDRDYTERQFTYDARGRLASYADHHIYADSTQENCPDNQITCDPPPPWDLNWHDATIRSATYNPDNSGNRTDGSASLSNDRLSSMTGVDSLAYSFSYDNEGRPSSKTASGYSQTYGWNDLGQLVWVKTNGDSVAYGYDAAGRRVRKDHSGSTTQYLWDGDNLLMELDGSGNRVREYSYQPGVDRPVSLKAGGSLYYYQLDEAGNVVAVWNTSNSKVVTYTYDPYGFRVDSSGSFAQPLRWKGREYDSETGLYYIRARYYDPSVGRFVSEDPIGLAGGINPYTFGDGDPVNLSDPRGTCTWNQIYKFSPLLGMELPGSGWLSGEDCDEILHPSNSAGGGQPTAPQVGRPHPGMSTVCKADIVQAGVNLGAHMLGLGVGKLAGSFVATAFPKVVADIVAAVPRGGAQIARWAGGGDQLFKQAMLTPAVAGAKWALNQDAGSATPGGGWVAGTYTVMKFAPYLGLGMDIGESVNSCLLSK